MQMNEAVLRRLHLGKHREHFLERVRRDADTVVSNAECDDIGTTRCSHSYLPFGIGVFPSVGQATKRAGSSGTSIFKTCRFASITGRAVSVAGYNILLVAKEDGHSVQHHAGHLRGLDQGCKTWRMSS